MFQTNFFFVCIYHHDSFKWQMSASSMRWILSGLLLLCSSLGDHKEQGKNLEDCLDLLGVTFFLSAFIECEY